MKNDNLPPEPDKLLHPMAEAGSLLNDQTAPASSNAALQPLMSRWKDPRAIVSTVYTLPLDQNPAAVYLARLTSALSRRTMKDALDKIARLGGHADALDVDWSQLSYGYTMAIRTQLAATYAPATANKILSALRGVLKRGAEAGVKPFSAHDFQTDLRR